MLVDKPQSGVAVLLVGVLDKVGTYGFLRWCLPLFPDAAKYFAPLAIALSLVGIIYGALLAVGQNDLKRLVAYTSIAHFGFIAMGCFAFTTQAGSGAVLYMVNHGISAGALFLTVGFLARRLGSGSGPVKISDLGGAVKAIPIISGVFFIAGLSSLALPGTNSFVSEFMVLIGTFTTYPVAAIIATVGIVFAALYILWAFQRSMQGTVNPKLPSMKDLTFRESWVIAPLIFIIIALGVYPKPVLDVINPSVKTTLSYLHVSDPAPSALGHEGGSK